MATRIVFITGTDTGVGKTLLTGLLLWHLRARGACALALKPFCSGGRADAELLCELQNAELTLDEVNPFYFPEPIAPLVSARKHKRRITVDQVLEHIQAIASRVGQIHLLPAESSRIKDSNPATENFLLIEGSGGLLVPLGKGYSVLDVITRLDCEVVVVSRNRLGTINHTLLTVQALQRSIGGSAPRDPRSSLKVVLMDSSAPDLSSASNAAILAELLAPLPLVLVPFVGARACRASAVSKHARLLKGPLARVVS